MQNEECRMQNSRKRYIFTRSRGWMFASLSVTDSVPRTERECCATLHDLLSLNLEPIETAPSEGQRVPMAGEGAVQGRKARVPSGNSLPDLLLQRRSGKPAEVWVAGPSYTRGPRTSDKVGGALASSPAYTL